VGLRQRLLASLRFSFGKLMEDLTPWFLLGFLISGLITVVVPEDFFGDTIPGGFVAMLMMLVLSMPMYICATASTPVAAALVLKGLDPGAALVLLLAGPATNITTMLVVRNFLGTAVLRVYLLSLIVVSLALGWLVNLLYESMDIDLASEPSKLNNRSSPTPFHMCMPWNTIGSRPLGVLYSRRCCCSMLGACGSHHASDD